MRRHARAGYWSMLLSAWVLLIAGVALLAVPRPTLVLLADGNQSLITELLRNPVGALLPQLLGAIYIGFGMMNWMTRGQILGGIYGRPVCFGNLFHFAVGTLFLVFQLATGVDSIGVLTVAAVYLLFCLVFIRLTFRMPSVAEHL